MSKFQSVLCFMMFPFLMLAQEGRITGTVSNAEEPLVGAVVKVIPAISMGTTNREGIFILDHLKPGQYTLEISYLGHEPAVREVAIVEDEEIVMDVHLQPNAALDEIVVTGTMRPTYVKDSPIKVDVITSKQLDTYIPAAASSVVEGIQLVNGIQEVVACGVCYTNSISINGLDGAYTAILMDGTPMYGNLASVYGLNGIPNMIIDRFEVIKGPSSTLYGSEAVAGVINIITKEPKEQPLLSLDIMGTTHKESFGNVAVAPRIGNTAGYIGYNYAYVNDFDDNNFDGFGDAINLDRHSLFTKWEIARPSGKSFVVAGKYYYEDRRNGVADYLKDRAYRTLRGSSTVYGESIYTHRMELFGHYTFNTRPNLKLEFSFSDHNQDSYYGRDFYRADQQIAFANLIWTTEKKGHHITAGLTTRYNAYDDNTMATEELMPDGSIMNKADNNITAGLFVQDEIRISDQFTVMSGARLDHYASHGLIFAPRFNLKYQPSEWTTFRSNFGTGFRVVNLFTEDHAFITGQRSVVISETLDPERSFNASFHINQVYTLLGGSGSMDIEGFYTHFTNKIIPDYGQPGKIIYANSDGYARTMGLGLNINYSASFPLGVSMGVHIQRATEAELDDMGKTQIRKIEFAPDWTGLFIANYKWQKLGLTLALSSKLTGTMALPEVYDLNKDGIPLPLPRPIISKPFSLHNFQISKEFNSAFTLYVGIQNLLNFTQEVSPLIGYNDPRSAVGFSEYFDTSYAYAPNHGREFYLGIKFNAFGNRE